jgi:ubiquinone/menaquinone biosynthesis C-methylase UbiE
MRLEMRWRDPKIELYKEAKLIKCFDAYALSSEVCDGVVDLLIVDEPINRHAAPNDILSEAGRVLKRNGFVHLSCLIIEAGHTPFSGWHYRHKCKKLGAKYTLEEIEKLIEMSGFIINKNAIEEEHSRKYLKLELIKLESDTFSNAVSY